ncbi:MAG: hypothetical protein ABIJ30_10195 [bacterium]
MNVDDFWLAKKTSSTIQSLGYEVVNTVQFDEIEVNKEIGDEEFR